MFIIATVTAGVMSAPMIFRPSAVSRPMMSVSTHIAAPRPVVTSPFVNRPEVATPNVAPRVELADPAKKLRHPFADAYTPGLLPCSQVKLSVHAPVSCPPLPPMVP